MSETCARCQECPIRGAAECPVRRKDEEIGRLHAEVTRLRGVSLSKGTEITRLNEEIARYRSAMTGTPLPPEPRPRIVCLCGSTRFFKEFQQANFEETMKGRIVLSVGFYSHSEERMQQTHGEGVGVTPEQKVALDELHKRKIDLADEVLILNVGGYIGESTRGELEHARKTGKPVRFLEPEGD